jgi:hypothetical protein
MTPASHPARACHHDHDAEPVTTINDGGTLVVLSSGE